MLSFENFVKSMPPSLSELKVIPSFCFAFKIPDDVTASNTYRLRFFVRVGHKATYASKNNVVKGKSAATTAVEEEVNVCVQIP